MSEDESDEKAPLWSEFSLRVVLGTVVLAAVGALLAWILKYWFVSAAIVFIAAGFLFLAWRHRISKRAKRRRAGLALVAVALGLAAIAVLAFGIPRARSEDRERQERLIEKLRAGLDVAAFTDALGTPEYRRRAGEVNVLMFERRWVTVVATVTQSGEVIGYGVYANSEDFEPRFGDVTLNSSRVSQQERSFLGSGVAAFGYCGAHQTNLFVSYGVSGATSNRAIVLGVGDGSQTGVTALCNAVLRGNVSRCLNLSNERLSDKVLSCMRRQSDGRMLLEELKATIYIETAPNQPLSGTILTRPYEVPSIRSP